MSSPNVDIRPSVAPSYVPSLDGLRALAVALVMAVHYHEEFGGGWVGVQLFFVLSGFLITRILLDAKSTATSLGGFLKAFWIRRALRIFPLFFAFMLVVEIFWQLASVPQTWPTARPWLLTYTLNFGHMFYFVPISDVYSHFWSLAVEEQFYLVWPFVIWFLSISALRVVVIFLLIATPLTRWWLVKTGIVEPYQLYFLTPTLLDSFAAGAALVLFDLQWIRNVRGWLFGTLAVTLLSGLLVNLHQGFHFALWSLGYPYFMQRAFQYAWGYTLLNLSAAILILACVRGASGIFANSMLVRLGKVSYGIYVIHRPLYKLITLAQPWLVEHFALMIARIISGGVFIFGSVLLAFLSYRFLETPFLKLKSNFRYQ
ncbi:MAG TPA: acyltransferase [Steroidobacteraceae bacterium]|jgi:peptidoglycan/LPS O-acetylase OafA/YrhL|nr:acyltransferase [Steroidobacteraceae bacterium]